MEQEYPDTAERLCLAVGVILVCAGLVCNEWLLAKWLSADGSLSRATRIQIWTFDAALTLAGLTLAKGRRSIPAVVVALQKRRVLFFVSYCAFWLFLLMFAAEVALRIKGYGPWQPQASDTVVEPGGKLYARHPTLGYASLPGKFRIRYPDGYSFEATHLSNTLRATHPVSSDRAKRDKPEIWVFGCSFTYGAFLNDSDTFPWLLQERLPEYEVVNFGVSGYGTLHSLIQLREALQRGTKPQVAIIAYASFHDERNTFLRSWRKSIVPHNKIDGLTYPYARVDQNGKLQILYDDQAYHEFPLMRYSALMHFVEKCYNRFEDRFYRSHEVSKAIIKEFSRLCKKNGVEFVVATLFTTDISDFCKTEGIQTVDIFVDWRIRENKIRDGHPSAHANRQYAQKLGSFLKQSVLNQPQPVAVRGK